MNEFFQVDKHLTSKRIEACDEFNKYLITEIANISASNILLKDDIETMYNRVYKKVYDRYVDDCRVFYTCFPDKIMFYNEIRERDLEKIEEFKDYKLSLVFNKIEKEICMIDKFTLQKWLSEKAL